MKQFLLNVLATIVGLFVTMVLCSMLSFIMLIAIMAAGMSEETPRIKKDTVLKITLEGSLMERESASSFADQLRAINGDESKMMSLAELVKAIDGAVTDDKIVGIYLDCRGVSAMPASLEFVREKLEKFKESGKWIVSYADNYAQSDYYLASVADSVWVNPVGSVDIHGLGGTTLYYKDLLDKLGVEMQVFRVGKFKSAVEPYIESVSSEANRQQTMEYLDGMWSTMAGDIAASRQVSVEQVNMWADSLVAFDDPVVYPELKLATGLIYRHEVEDKLKVMAGIDEDDDLRTIDPKRYVKTVTEDKANHKVALLYADGAIYDSGREGVVSEKLVPVILDLADDDDIEALVLRVNSPGGSSYASEQIWEALEVFKSKGKPFYVSMSDMAASGGYYISCGADKIFAQPTTLTGSIGIYGLVPNLNTLIKDKVGLTPNTFATNPNGVLSIIEPFNPAQKVAFQKAINRGYETFVGRCAAGRKVSVDSIKTIAQGRVWVGTDAKRIGLVDELGSLSDCLADLAETAGYDSYEVIPYPDAGLEWWEQILLDAETIKASYMRSELGACYPVYKVMKDLEKVSRIQARAPQIVIQ